MWQRWVLALALTGSACEPVGGAPPPEPPSAPKPATSTTAETTASAAASAAPAATPRCVVPLAENPPPAAEPATDCPTAPSAALKLSRGFVGFPDAPGQVRVAVEVAASGPARERGLMYRTQMAQDEGMLFSWPTEAPRSFWMKNTCLPLDMLFIDQQGFIVGILEQVPVMNLHPRAVSCPATHVLEVNAGWAREHAVKPGQRVAFEYVAE